MTERCAPARVRPLRLRAVARQEGIYLEVGLITVSVGVAEYNPSRPSEADLMVLADRALYLAKAAGKNMVGTVSGVLVEN